MEVRLPTPQLLRINPEALVNLPAQGLRLCRRSNNLEEHLFTADVCGQESPFLDTQVGDARWSGNANRVHRAARRDVPDDGISIRGIRDHSQESAGAQHNASREADTRGL